MEFVQVLNPEKYKTMSCKNCDNNSSITITTTKCGGFVVMKFWIVCKEELPCTDNHIHIYSICLVRGCVSILDQFVHYSLFKVGYICLVTLIYWLS